MNEEYTEEEQERMQGEELGDSKLSTWVMMIR